MGTDIRIWAVTLVRPALVRLALVRLALVHPALALLWPVGLTCWTLFAVLSTDDIPSIDVSDLTTPANTSLPDV